jgi:RNA polymerase sigma-54 factor
VNSLDLRTEHRQTQTLSPRLQHAVRLLQMSSLDFAAMLRDTLGKNPFLEVDDIDGAEGMEGAEGAQPLTTLHDGATVSSQLEAATADGAAELSTPAGDLSGAAEIGDAGESGDNGDSDRDLWTADGGAGVRRSEDGELSALDMMAVETSLTAHLHGQLNVLPLSERDLALAQIIVESLDDDGYLRTPLEDLLTVAELDPVPELQEMQIALKLVQSLDPAGGEAPDGGA